MESNGFQYEPLNFLACLSDGYTSGERRNIGTERCIALFDDKLVDQEVC